MHQIQINNNSPLNTKYNYAGKYRETLYKWSDERRKEKRHASQMDQYALEDELFKHYEKNETVGNPVR